MDNQQEPKHQPESRKTLCLFFTFGFLEYLLFSTIIASAEDLLKGFSSSTGMIWVALALPCTVLPTIVPYFFDRLPPLLFILALFPLAIGGLLALLLGNSVWFKYLSVVLCGVIQSLGEVTSVSLTAYFDKVTVKYYCLGTGFGYVIGPLYYTAMTSWLHISSYISISAIIIMNPIVFLSSFSILENRRGKMIEYQRIDEDPKQGSQKHHHLKQNLSMSEKLHSSLKMLPEVTQIFLGILFHDLVLSGVTTTIAFPDSPFSSSDHYKYYLIMSFAGLCLGRSYLGIAEYIKPGLSDKLLVRHTWSLVLVACFHVLLLIFDSLFRFIPNVWVILFLVFSLGFWAEAIYLNVNVILGEISDSRARELSMGLAVFGVGFGALIGAIISRPVENVLVKHCVQFTNQTSFCLTRETTYVSKY
ncbi:protein BTN1-like isoform X1 [Actinia tenebrosa]|uniref:Battenin n=1 Tax=Actinia tenebrosa TaxID=6105 RepID=A0A6P8HY93_ACTTE|nr:protein BTN1-like isoform X1 [Actinia tenebrosa]XP_031560344.1 protein BTN1-like isoform X1 [Actinia tenebrosa]XP_031560345.1 protein BTN1-like isoform X1 [Actinia tenebrosa]